MADKDKKAFILFMNHKEDIDDLSDIQAGRIMKAIYNYNDDGTEPDFSDDLALRILWRKFKEECDYNNGKWENIKQRRAAAGKKGMSSRWSNDADKTAITKNNNVITNDNTVITKNNNVITSDNKVISADNKDITKITVNDNVNDNVNVNVNVNDNVLTHNNIMSGKPDDVPDRAKAKKAENAEVIRSVIAYLNEKTGKNFSDKSKAAQSHINARLKEGYTEEQLIRVIDNMSAQWKGTEWEKYLQPSTLFNAEKFDGYLNRSPPAKTQYDNYWDEYMAEMEQRIAEMPIS